MSCVCTYCGQPVTTTNAKKHPFCDNRCRELYNESRRLVVQCIYCGRLLEWARWQVERSRTGQVFCDQDCQQAWYADQHVQIKCAHCGKKIDLHAYRLDAAEHHFCNHQCKGAWMSEHLVGPEAPKYKADRATVFCVICGHPFRVSPSKLERNERFFCSRACFGIWKSENWTGTNNPYRWEGGSIPYYGPNWYRQRRKALKRDEHKCQLCGKTADDNGRALDVHHIVPFREFGYVRGQNTRYKQANALTNLITLCMSCHVEAETHGLRPELMPERR